MKGGFVVWLVLVLQSNPCTLSLFVELETKLSRFLSCAMVQLIFPKRERFDDATKRSINFEGPCFRTVFIHDVLCVVVWLMLDCPVKHQGKCCCDCEDCECGFHGCFLHQLKIILEVIGLKDNAPPNHFARYFLPPTLRAFCRAALKRCSVHETHVLG